MCKRKALTFRINAIVALRREETLPWPGFFDLSVPAQVTVFWAQNHHNIINLAIQRPKLLSQIRSRCCRNISVHFDMTAQQCALTRLGRNSGQTDHIWPSMCRRPSHVFVFTINVMDVCKYYIIMMKNNLSLILPKKAFRSKQRPKIYMRSLRLVVLPSRNIFRIVKITLTINITRIAETPGQIRPLQNNRYFDRQECSLIILTSKLEHLLTMQQ